MEIQNAANRQAIEHLMAKYAHHGDRGVAGAGNVRVAVAQLFAPDGVWESGTAARFEGGKPSLQAAAVPRSGSSSASCSIPSSASRAMTQEGAGIPLLLTGRHPASRWGVGRYSARRRRTTEGWRIARLTADTVARTSPEAFGITAI